MCSLIDYSKNNCFFKIVLRFLEFLNFEKLLVVVAYRSSKVIENK